MLQEYNRFANCLANDVLAKLEGAHPDFDRVMLINKPSRSIILGSLADSKLNKKKSKSSVKNNNMSVKFLLNGLLYDIDVKPSFSVYYKVFPTFEEQKEYISNLDDDKFEHQFAPIWKRKKCDFDFIKLNNDSNNVSLDIKNFIEEIYHDDLFFTARRDDVIEDCSDEGEYYDKIRLFTTGKIPDLNWNCEIYLNSSKITQNDVLFDLVEVGMVNLSEENPLYETFIFDCNFQINLNDNKLNKFIYSYDEDDEIKFYTSDLRTLNCHANYDKDNNIINTIHYAKFKDKKLEPRNDFEGFDAQFEILMSEKCVDHLERLYDLMCDFEKRCINNLDNHKDFENFKDSKQNFLEGLNALKKYPNALKAFQLMNKSFFENSKGKYSSWRLFQIVFIVSVIPEIIDKNSKRETCDLLHVMTGGGKSESYFGIVIFTAFYDRLNGKKFGVSAWTKFPLRMLSIQQLQRVSSLFMWAEEIRLKEGILGDPFTVAYFVGNQNPEFPKNNDSLIDEIKDSEKTPGKIISICPICGAEVVLSVDDDKSLIMHECLGCHKRFGLFFTDFEIFRVLPTFIISTVDKLAAISSQYRIKNILGGKLDKCSEGHGFIPRGSKCMVNGCESDNIPVNIDFNTGPSLIIQDELHLIKEGFGTINSHFESCYQALSNKFSNENYKYIAMTATVNGAAKQIKELYNKEIRIFPPRLTDKEGDEFFFKYSIEDGKQVYNRQIIGLKPNNVDNNTAIILSLRYVSEFIKKVESMDNFASKYNFDETLLEDILNSYKSILSYHLRVSDVHNTKNYVGRNINDSTLDVYKIDSMTLTGDDSLDTIKEVISSVENFNIDRTDDKLQLTSATNIVSHGIDLDNWNLMFFQGIPRSTSEYIQALSRVGRKFHGLIFLWFYPNRVRDLSFYQNFNEYHNILQYKVEKVPISRWTKLGFKQTFTSIFNAGILSFLSDELENVVYNREDVVEVLSNEKYRELLVDFINKSYISSSDEIGADYFRNNIEIEVDKRIKHLKEYTGAETFLASVLSDSTERYFKVQSGMRGIQDTVNVKRSLPFCFYNK